MKLYCKIKRDGIWSWMVADDPWKVATARALCECRVCKPAKPEIISTDSDECQCKNCLNEEHWALGCIEEEDSTPGVE